MFVQSPCRSADVVKHSKESVPDSAYFDKQFSYDFKALHEDASELLFAAGFLDLHHFTHLSSRTVREKPRDLHELQATNSKTFQILRKSNCLAIHGCCCYRPDIFLAKLVAQASFAADAVGKHSLERL